MSVTITQFQTGNKLEFLQKRERVAKNNYDKFLLFLYCFW